MLSPEMTGAAFYKSPDSENNLSNSILPLSSRITRLLSPPLSYSAWCSCDAIGGPSNLSSDCAFVCNFSPNFPPDLPLYYLALAAESGGELRVLLDLIGVAVLY